jgi:HSP20 family protein
MFGFPGWGWRSPFAELERMSRVLDQLASGAGPGTLHAGVFPSVNLTEDKDNYYIRAELPGLDAGDLDIQTAVNSLAISGERKIAVEQGVKYHRREREAGKFSRVIHLPKAANMEKVEASLVNGVLSISVPKSEEAKPRQIAIK